MSTSGVVQRVDELPAGLDYLIQASSHEGFRFLDRLRDEWVSGVNRFVEPGEAFFVAHAAGVLAGVCGVNRDPYSSSRDVGRLRRLYVSPQFRRQGVARSLVEVALALAREHYELVRIRTDNPQAATFYGALGFVPVTSSSEATHELAMRGGGDPPPNKATKLTGHSSGQPW
jgi:GNAT superfamily N-acetyltransferase